MSKDWRVYAHHIVDTWAKINRILARGTVDDELIYDALLRNLQTLAESTQHLPDELKANYPEIPWRDIGGFRNILVHNYLGDIAQDSVADVLTDDLPALIEAITKMLEKDG